MAVAVSYDVDYGSRNAVLRQLGLAAGLTATALDQTAGETHPNWVAQVNKINVALGLPTYSSLDRNAFQTVIGAMIAKINTPPPTNPPVVAPSQEFELELPTTANHVVGQVSATNNPTGFAIASGNPNGYFAINAIGNLSVTTAGAAGITDGNDILGITATNADGTSPAVNVTVAVVTP
jgi:hypothetical protein